MPEAIIQLKSGSRIVITGTSEASVRGMSERFMVAHKDYLEFLDQEIQRQYQNLMIYGHLNPFPDDAPIYGESPLESIIPIVVENNAVTVEKEFFDNLRDKVYGARCVPAEYLKPAQPGTRANTRLLLPDVIINKTDEE